MYRVHRIPRILFRSVAGESGAARTAVFLVGIPCVASVISYATSTRVYPSFLELIATSMTLFVGFSMNAVVLMFRYAENSEANHDFIAQVRNLSVYLVTLGFFILFVDLIGVILINNSSNPAISKLGTALLLGALMHFFMVALLFPARIFSLVENIGGNEPEVESEAEQAAVRRKSSSSPD